MKFVICFCVLKIMDCGYRINVNLVKTTSYCFKSLLKSVVVLSFNSHSGASAWGGVLRQNSPFFDKAVC